MRRFRAADYKFQLDIFFFCGCSRNYFYLQIVDGEKKKVAELLPGSFQVFYRLFVRDTLGPGVC
jgi:hypothetical protein